MQVNYIRRGFFSFLFKKKKKERLKPFFCVARWAFFCCSRYVGQHGQLIRNAICISVLFRSIKNTEELKKYFNRQLLKKVTLYIWYDCYIHFLIYSFLLD